MKPGNWVAFLAGGACLAIAVAEARAFTMTERPDNISIGVGIKYPTPPGETDNLYRSQVPAPGGGGNSEEVSYEIEVCCCDCNKPCPPGEPCGVGNCTPSFSVEFVILLPGGGITPTQTEDVPADTDLCPLCVTKTIKRTVTHQQQGQRSVGLTIQNVPADCACCNDESMPWAEAWTYFRELGRWNYDP